MNSITLAILASAYNVCGPRSGAPATPATVMEMADQTVLELYARAYSKHVTKDADRLYSVAQVSDALAELERT